MRARYLLLSTLVLIFSAGLAFKIFESRRPTLKLYWLIPDGLRAEPDVFQMYKWAAEGELPNIKRMMETGVYGYSIPVFPSHTPVNFATLLTGADPVVHGVADGPMHIEGHPLNTVSLGGFSSLARKVPAAWTIFEDHGEKVAVISTPGSTPPELKRGIVVRGRWGGWGFDTPALNFEHIGNNRQRVKMGRATRLFYSGPQLTQFTQYDQNPNWQLKQTSENPIKYFTMSAYGVPYQGALLDSTQDGLLKYDTVVFADANGQVLESLKEQEWGKWHPTQVQQNNVSLNSNVKFHVIKLDGDGFFKVRLFFNNLNNSLIQPSELLGSITGFAGPMMDFVDNFPPQLIYYDEDQLTFLSEMKATFNWHTHLIPNLVKRFEPGIVIHNIYSPNQMLTSRWWMGAVDPKGKDFNKISVEKRQEKWREVKSMYKMLDNMVGEILASKDDNTLVVLSSDHGATPLLKSVHINNLLSKLGYLKFTMNRETGEPNINWNSSKAIYLKMDGIYIQPDGLDGNYKRASGPQYDKIRESIIGELAELKDSNGIKPVSMIVKWEDAPLELGLPNDRVGDLVIANLAGYGWSEEMSADLNLFSESLVSGYKQAILNAEVNDMWTPFIIAGPGIKKGMALNEPIHHVDQLPTILKALNIHPGQKMTGKTIDEAFTQ